MPRKLYSYRLGKCVTLLTDEEFERVEIHLRAHLSAAMKYLKEMDRSTEAEKDKAMDEARANNPAGKKAIDVYEEITGHRLDHPEQLYAVRLSEYGGPCLKCGRPFRIPRARLCAECGFHLPEGKTAGTALES